MATLGAHSRSRVWYYHAADIGLYDYGSYTHPMRPFRVNMAHELVVQYGLHKHLTLRGPVKLSGEEMTKFHSNGYIKMLKKEITTTNFGEDCPMYWGVFEFNQLCAGGSVEGAVTLNNHEADIAINWSGGFHHAKRDQAAGFCYVNDIVLAILELLKVYQRVLYIDIDIHHGDGVEEAFYTTDRVMTVSFHKYDTHFFPGTGALNDTGQQKGRFYTVNVPLLDGIDDESYFLLFSEVMGKVIERFLPHAIVLQCGADSLSGDRIGSFNLTVKGHGKCVEFIKSYNLPLLLLGGGGYTMRNVARCWAHETAVAVNVELDNCLPFNDHFELYCDTYQLNNYPSNATNMNTRSYLNKLKEEVFKNIHMLPHAPNAHIILPASYHEKEDSFRLSEEDDFDNPEDEKNRALLYGAEKKPGAEKKAPKRLGGIKNVIELVQDMPVSSQLDLVDIVSRQERRRTPANYCEIDSDDDDFPKRKKKYKRKRKPAETEEKTVVEHDGWKPTESVVMVETRER